MDIINIIADEVTGILGVCALCYVVVKIRDHKRRHLPKRPEMGETYLSSFPEDQADGDYRNRYDRG